eukprot:scaffold38088_cov25-Tisochrysis_lutea.AAC.3
MPSVTSRAMPFAVHCYRSTGTIRMQRERKRRKPGKTWAVVVTCNRSDPELSHECRTHGSAAVISAQALKCVCVICV